MKHYDVELRGSITERVEANNGEEARQLAIRMTNIRLGNVGPGFIVETITTEVVK